jgi:hypothetical protein
MEQLLKQKVEKLQAILQAQAFLINTQRELDQIDAQIKKLEEKMDKPEQPEVK